MRFSNRFFAQDDRAGALPTLYAATADLPGASYVGPDGIAEMRGGPTLVGRTAAASDPEVARRLWTVSEELTKVTFPAVLSGSLTSAVRRNVRRYVSGGTPIVRLKWRRRVAAVPMPVASAMASTLRSVVSSNSWARRMRWVRSHWRGLVPVAVRKWRPRWRELIRAWRARSSTVSGRSSRSTIQGSRADSGWSSRSGTGAATNWAWPPARWGGTTSLRATELATEEPWSRRTRCRHRSSAAALPHGGEDGPVVDVEDVRVHLDRRMAGGEDVGVGPVGRGPPAVQETGRGQHERARAQGRHPGTGLVGGPYRVGQGGGRCHVDVRPAGDDHEIGVRQPVEALVGVEPEPAEPHGVRPAHRDVVPGDGHVDGCEAEHLVGDGHFEVQHALGHGQRDGAAAGP